jgi:hypothetical protein
VSNARIFFPLGLQPKSVAGQTDVVRVGEAGSSMYFIHQGHVEVLDKKGRVC